MKMNVVSRVIYLVSAVVLIGSAYSCQQAGGNKTGSEFIPDMTHSVAYEANVLTNYSLNTWDKESVRSRWELSQPRVPVSGTVPRGYAAIGNYDLRFPSAVEAVLQTAQKLQKNDGRTVYQPNGHVPYFYAATEEGRLEAIAKVRYNPFPITTEGIARGQQLFTIYCAICHGDKGDGNGYIVTGPQSKYLAQPANLMNPQFINDSNGRLYHAIVYGRNLMGSHADKLSFEERWQVIHYLRQLQAKSIKVNYNEDVNELNPEFGVPYKQVKGELEALQTTAKEDTDPSDESSQNGGQH